MLKVELFGVKTAGAMAPDISLANQRPAEFIFSRHVQQAMDKLAHETPAKRTALEKQNAEVADAAD